MNSNEEDPRNRAHGPEDRMTHSWVTGSQSAASF